LYLTGVMIKNKSFEMETHKQKESSKRLTAKHEHLLSHKNWNNLERTSAKILKEGKLKGFQLDAFQVTRWTLRRVQAGV